MISPYYYQAKSVEVIIIHISTGSMWHNRLLLHSLIVMLNLSKHSALPFDRLRVTSPYYCQVKPAEVIIIHISTGSMWHNRLLLHSLIVMLSLSKHSTLPFDRLRVTSPYYYQAKPVEVIIIHISTGSMWHNRLLLHSLIVMLSLSKHRLYLSTGSGWQVLTIVRWNLSKSLSSTFRQAPCDTIDSCYIH